jgi:GSH-dependent disulfide-bond oxidoreductase
MYLAEKTGRLLPADPALRWQAVQWLMFQIGGVGPMFGQLGWFHKFDGRHIEDKRGHERYRAEAARLLNVLEGRMQGRDWIAGEFSIADIALVPWVNALDSYGVKSLVGSDRLHAVPAWVERFMARPAVRRGVTIPSATV